MMTGTATASSAGLTKKLHRRVSKALALGRQQQRAPRLARRRFCTRAEARDSNRSRRTPDSGIRVNPSAPHGPYAASPSLLLRRRQGSGCGAAALGRGARGADWCSGRRQTPSRSEERPELGRRDASACVDAEVWLGARKRQIRHVRRVARKQLIVCAARGSPSPAGSAEGACRHRDRGHASRDGGRSFRGADDRVRFWRPALKPDHGSRIGSSLAKVVLGGDREGGCHAHPRRSIVTAAKSPHRPQNRGFSFRWSRILEQNPRVGARSSAAD